MLELLTLEHLEDADPEQVLELSDSLQRVVSLLVDDQGHQTQQVLDVGQRKPETGHLQVEVRTLLALVDVGPHGVVVLDGAVHVQQQRTGQSSDCVAQQVDHHRVAVMSELVRMVLLHEAVEYEEGGVEGHHDQDKEQSIGQLELAKDVQRDLEELKQQHECNGYNLEDSL